MQETEISILSPAHPDSSRICLISKFSVLSQCLFFLSTYLSFIHTLLDVFGVFKDLKSFQTSQSQKIRLLCHPVEFYWKWREGKKKSFLRIFPTTWAQFTPERSYAIVFLLFSVNLWFTMNFFPTGPDSFILTKRITTRQHKCSN